MKKNLLKNSIYNTLGGVIRLGLGIVTIPLLIRELGIEEYGLWTLASALVGVVTLAEAGLSTSTTVFVAQNLGEGDTTKLTQTLTVILVTMMLLASVTSAMLWLYAPQISILFPELTLSNQIYISRTLQVAAIVVWTKLLQQVMVGIEQAYQRYDLLNFIGTAQLTITNIGMLFIVFYKGHAIEMMTWQAIVSTVSLLIHILIVKTLLRNIYFRLVWDRQQARRIVLYSSSVWLTSLGNTLFNRVDRLIVGNVLGVQTLGVYSAITDITTQINTLSALPVQPLVPFISNFLSGSDKGFGQLKFQLKKALTINVTVAMGFGCILINASPEILPLLFPLSLLNEYQIAFVAATIIYSAYSLNAVGYYILMGTQRMNICANIVVLSGILSLILTSLGAYYFGLIGAILGNSGYLLTLLLPYLGLKKMNISLTILKIPIFLIIIYLFSAIFSIVLSSRASIFWIRHSLDLIPIAIFLLFLKFNSNFIEET